MHITGKIICKIFPNILVYVASCANMINSLYGKSICSSNNIIKEIHIEDHLKGTLEDQMQYNRRTLEELNSILFDTSNQVCINHRWCYLKTYMHTDNIAPPYRIRYLPLKQK